jgi:hypothetical protein
LPVGSLCRTRAAKIVIASEAKQSIAPQEEKWIASAFAQSRISIGPYKRHELLTGRITYPSQGYSGYGNGISTEVAAFIGDEMRSDRAANREELVKVLAVG